MFVTILSEHNYMPVQYFMQIIVILSLIISAYYANYVSTCMRVKLSHSSRGGIMDESNMGWLLI